MGVSGTVDPALGEVTGAVMGNGESEAATDQNSVNKLLEESSGADSDQVGEGTEEHESEGESEPARVNEGVREELGSRLSSPPIPAPRQSVRERQAPAWLCSNEYLCKQAQGSMPQHGWAERANFLVFPGIRGYI